MAGIVTAGRMPDPEDFDYSVSHRAVPVPAVPYSSIAPGGLPQSGDEPGRPSRGREEAASVHSNYPEGRRRGSLGSLLRRSSSHQAKERKEVAPPPLPATRVAQAHIEAQQAQLQQPQQQQHIREASTTSTTWGSRKLSLESAKPNMLRRASKARQEQERLAREAAAANAVPTRAPRLETIHPLPTLSTFGGEDTDARPDSYPIFNHSYSHNSHSPPRQPLPQAPPANFSRPGAVAAMPAYSNNSSSSPAYAIRPGNAFAAQQAGRSVNGGGEYVDHAYDRSESMTHRGRYSYTSSAAQVNVNSPRRVRRRKDPTPFNVLVIGAKSSGKTSFISFLRHSLALPPHKQPHNTDKESESQVHASKSSFTSHYLESEMDGERIGVTLWDSAGLEKHIIDLQLREMTAFVESKFEETFVEEQKVMRSPGVKDTHIHCVFLVLDPVRLDSNAATSSARQVNGAAGGLDASLDLQVMRSLWGKTTVIPVIAKADTLTTGHMSFLKRAVWDSLKAAKIDPLEALELEGDEEEDDDTLAEDEGVEDKAAHSGSDSDSDSDFLASRSKRNGHNRQSSLAGPIAGADGEDLPYLPMSILSPDLYDLPPYAQPSKTSNKIGRRFPWGFADPYDPEHCDFMRLRDSIFSEWRADLRDLARTKWYENWRTSRLKNIPGTKQRVRGGVTPLAAVPREGRTSPAASRSVSQNTMAVPRSVSNVGIAVGGPPLRSGMSKAERVMGYGGENGQMY